MNKDCAGQCFGSHKPTDLSCHCPTFLDGCYVCGGDNSSCAGCDGIPFSGLVYDYCGVCNGDSTRCCYGPDSVVTIRLKAYEALPSYIRVVTGQMVVFASIDPLLDSDNIVVAPLVILSLERKEKVFQPAINFRTRVKPRCYRLWQAIPNN